MTNDKEFDVTLSQLAYDWRSALIKNDKEAAEKVLREYHKQFKVYWDTGWRGDMLEVYAELPQEFMPDYYLKYWDY